MLLRLADAESPLSAVVDRAALSDPKMSAKGLLDSLSRSKSGVGLQSSSPLLSRVALMVDPQLRQSSVRVRGWGVERAEERSDEFE